MLPEVNREDVFLMDIELSNCLEEPDDSIAKKIRILCTARTFYNHRHNKRYLYY